MFFAGGGVKIRLMIVKVDGWVLECGCVRVYCVIRWFVFVREKSNTVIQGM